MSPNPEFGGGEQFLHQKNQELHTSDPVEHEQERRKRADEDTHQKPVEKLADWMQVLEKIHMGHREDPRVLERIKESYHKQLVIKPEDVPEGYFENQQRLARERGYGDIEIGNEQRQQLSETLISDQESTLDTWLDYLTSKDSDSFPMWAKYWAFEGMRKLSSYDKETHSFSKRDKGTVAPFPDLNREALAHVIDVVIKKANKEHVSLAQDDPEFKKILDGANFGKLYAYAIEKVTPTDENELINTKGEWVKYDKGSDHMPLVESLQGYGTNWCTAGESTAQSQLQAGDFYVYYSNDKQGKPTLPRVAIRMEGDHIAEVRGIVGKDQNLDPYIGDVLDKKLDEFPDKEKYEKKTADMKQLTEIDSRVKAGEELTKEDLKFLYQIDSQIQGFGYKEDPRIEEILKGRNIKEDVSLVTGYSQDEISLTKEEALEGEIKFHYGHLYLQDLTSAEGLKLPESISGNLYLSSLTSAEGLKLPESISGNLNLPGLTSAEGLKLPESVGGNLDLSYLTSAEGLKLPESVGGSLYLSSLTSAEGLKLPESVGGTLSLPGLTSAEGLKLPESVGGSLSLKSLTSAEGLKLPESVGGSLYLSGLTSAEGLKLPESLSGNLDLSGLTSAEGLKLPESIGGNLYLPGLTSAEGLKLPESIGGDLSLLGLTSAEGLKLPESIGGDLYLSSLTSAEGLKFPESIGGNLYLPGLTSAEGLKLPKSIGGGLSLKGLTSAEGLKLPESIGGDLSLMGLTSAEGLNLPESIGGYVYFLLPRREKQEIKLKFPHLRIQ